MRTVFHIDFNSYFATIEQQANPRLRGKPIGVTGGDRLERTVIGAASIEAKKLGVKTGMPLYEARRICPEIILVRGDSDKYLECTKRFLSILKRYSPYLEIFSIDETFIELKFKNQNSKIKNEEAIAIALDIKGRIRKSLGEWVRCSIGISYNKLMAKLGSDLQKPDGLVVIEDQKKAVEVLDKVELDEICGIGARIKRRLNNMGIFDFRALRKVPLENLIASFKEHWGHTLYNMARGIDHSPIVPFYEKEEIKSVGHRHTLSHDSLNQEEIKQVLLKLTELVARRLRAKKLVGKTISCYFRDALKVDDHFIGNGMQVTIPHTDDGLEIFKGAWKIFRYLWASQKIRMVGVSVSNLQPTCPQVISFLENWQKKEVITKALDTINNKYGEFTLQRAVLLRSAKVVRKANPFIADRRFRL